MRKLFKAIGLAVVATVGAFASVVPADFAIDTTDIGTMAGVILTALGTIWIARKVIGFLSR